MSADLINFPECGSPSSSKERFLHRRHLIIRFIALGVSKGVFAPLFRQRMQEYLIKIAVFTPV